MKKLLNDFKAFALKGNVLDMAVGVIIGAAFGKIVSSLVNDVFMPLISLVTGGVNVSGLFIQLGRWETPFTSVDAAKAAGVSTLNYGLFLQTVIDFLLMAICVFLFVKMIAKLKKPAPVAPPARLCPHCNQPVHEEATRCPHCTSMIEEK